MPVSIVVGGQYGSEGKGKVAGYFAKAEKANIAVRIGGPNSGHTVYSSEKKPYIFRMLPTASIHENVVCVLTSGSYIDVDILQEEQKVARLPNSRLKIDPFAVIISDNHKANEREKKLNAKIGSTETGVGDAIIDRIARTKVIRFAKDVVSLKDVICDTQEYLRDNCDANIIIEGTQGFGLSLLHSNLYPFCTSRDTSAAGFLSETGLSPFDVKNIILVIRTFPIRVPGSSGPLPNEIDWDTVTFDSGSNTPLIEYTSVTKKVRRVARFDSGIVKRAISVNKPNCIVLNHLDYVDNSIYANERKICNRKVAQFINNIQDSLFSQEPTGSQSNKRSCEEIHYLGTAPFAIIPRGKVCNE